MSRRGLACIASAALVCAWCGWVSGFHRDTLGAEATWLLSLGAVVVVDLSLWAGRRGLSRGWHVDPATEPWPRPGRGGGIPAMWGTAPWTGLVLLALAWDVLALDTPPRQYHLTISALSQAYRPLNACLLSLWLGIGVAYGLTRARTPEEAGAPVKTPDTKPGAPLTGVFGLGSAAIRKHSVLAGRAFPGLLLPQVPAVGVVFWTAVPIVAIAIDQFARRSGGRIANGEEVLRFISTATPVKVLLVVAWAFAGYHLFAR